MNPFKSIPNISYEVWHLAVRNLFSGGLRTILNTIIISVVFAFIVFLQSFYSGFGLQMEVARIEQETGSSQLWASGFDPGDPSTYMDSSRPPPRLTQRETEKGSATALLFHGATLYHRGNVSPVAMAGIDAHQSVLHIDFGFAEHFSDPSVVIGRGFANTYKLEKGDRILLRWQTYAGAHEAIYFTVANIFHTDAPAMDSGKIWFDLDKLRDLLGSARVAHKVIFSQAEKREAPGWAYKNLDVLLEDTRKMIRAKSGGAFFIYGILIFMASVTLLDTQFLSVFRRRKEVGLLMALGLTPRQVSLLFTIEGVLQGILGVLIGGSLGATAVLVLETHGIKLVDLKSFGMAGTDKIYPYFDGVIFMFTCVLFVLISAFVSYYPSRRISSLTPAEAMRGKWL